MRNRKKRLWFKRQAELKKQEEAQNVAPTPVVEEKPPAPTPEPVVEKVVEEPKQEAPKPKRRRRKKSTKSAEE